MRQINEVQTVNVTSNDHEDVENVEAENIEKDIYIWSDKAVMLLLEIYGEKQIVGRDCLRTTIIMFLKYKYKTKYQAWKESIKRLKILMPRAEIKIQ